MSEDYGCPAIHGKPDRLLGHISQTDRRTRARAEYDGRTETGAVGYGSDAPEAVDRVDVLAPHLGIAHAQALLGSQAEHTDLALVQVLVDVVGGLADLVHAVALGQGRVDLALGDEP